MAYTLGCSGSNFLLRELCSRWKLKNVRQGLCTILLKFFRACVGGCVVSWSAKHANWAFVAEMRLQFSFTLCLGNSLILRLLQCLHESNSLSNHLKHTWLVQLLLLLFPFTKRDRGVKGHLPFWLVSHRACKVWSWHPLSHLSHLMLTQILNSITLQYLVKLPCK